MAKIVPQGYANINAYDEGDNYLQLLQYLDKFGTRMKDVKEKKLSYANASINDIVGLIDNVASENSLNAVENSMQVAMQESKDLNNPMLTLKTNAVNAIIGDKRAQFDGYKAGFEKLANAYTTEGSIFNPSMLPEMKETINNLGATGVSEKLRDLDAMLTSVIGADGKLLFPNYRTKDFAAADIRRMSSEMKGLMRNIRNSLGEDELVSDPEFAALLKYGGDYEGMEGLRQGILTHTSTLIGQHNKNSIGIDKAFFRIQQSGDKTLYKIYQDLQEEGTLFSGLNLEDFDLNNEVDRAVVGLDNEDITMDAIEQGYYFNEAGEKVQIPKMVLDRFNDFLTKLKKDQLYFDTESARQERRFNFWSPFPYASPHRILDLKEEGFNFGEDDFGDTEDPPAEDPPAKEVPAKEVPAEEVPAEDPPAEVEQATLEDYISKVFGGDEKFLSWLNDAQKRDRTDDEEEFLQRYGPEITKYFQEKQDAAAEEAPVEDAPTEEAPSIKPYNKNEKQYSIAPDSPWDLIDTHLSRGGKGVEFMDLMNQIEGNNARSLSKTANRKWVIKSLQTHGFSATAARTTANEMFKLIRHYYTVRNMKSGPKRDSELRSIRQQYQDIVTDDSRKQLNVPSLNLFKLFGG